MSVANSIPGSVWGLLRGASWSQKGYSAARGDQVIGFCPPWHWGPHCDRDKPLMSGPIRTALTEFPLPMTPWKGNPIVGPNLFLQCPAQSREDVPSGAHSQFTTLEHIQAFIKFVIKIDTPWGVWAHLFLPTVLRSTYLYYLSSRTVVQESALLSSHALWTTTDSEFSPNWTLGAIGTRSVLQILQFGHGLELLRGMHLFSLSDTTQFHQCCFCIICVLYTMFALHKHRLWRNSTKICKNSEGCSHSWSSAAVTHVHGAQILELYVHGQAQQQETQQILFISSYQTSSERPRRLCWTTHSGTIRMTELLFFHSKCKMLFPSD